jgi:hypothetical protein
MDLLPGGIFVGRSPDPWLSVAMREVKLSWGGREMREVVGYG